MALSRSNQVLAKETYPEPQTRAGVSNLIREILNAPGAVEKILLEKGRPVRAWRWVSHEQLEEEKKTLEGALSAAEIVEVSGQGSPWRVVFEMIQQMETEGVVPICWVSSTKAAATLRQWLSLRKSNRAQKMLSLIHI